MGWVQRELHLFLCFNTDSINTYYTLWACFFCLLVKKEYTFALIPWISSALNIYL